MEQLINIGILGCASIAKRSVLPAIKELKAHFNLIGVASRDEHKAQEWAQNFGAKPFHYQSLLDEAPIDAVYIPLPNSLHAEWIDKALDRGIHVLVEKSLATTYADAKRLNDKARNSKLILLENFQFRFHSQLNEIKSIIASGSIGDLRCMRSSFGFPGFKDEDNIRYQKDLGGGALLDSGAYPIKISQIFLGNGLVVKAAKLNYDNDKGVDIWGGGFIQQADGPFFSEVAFGFDHYYQCNIELWGSKGKLTAARIFTAHPEFEPEIIVETNNGIQNIKVPADNHFVNMLLHFNELIRDTGLAADEYVQNINQARLIEEFKNKANE